MGLLIGNVSADTSSTKSNVPVSANTNPAKQSAFATTNSYRAEVLFTMNRITAEKTKKRSRLSSPMRIYPGYG